MTESVTESESDPYLKALDDLSEKLDNAIDNGGGVHFGPHFVLNVHWDYEIRDQIEALRSEHTNQMSENSV